jgi:hypothetical protein
MRTGSQNTPAPPVDGLVALRDHFPGTVGTGDSLARSLGFVVHTIGREFYVSRECIEAIHAERAKQAAATIERATIDNDWVSVRILASIAKWSALVFAKMLHLPMRERNGEQWVRLSDIPAIAAKAGECRPDVPKGIEDELLRLVRENGWAGKTFVQCQRGAVDVDSPRTEMRERPKEFVNRRW